MKGERAAGGGGIAVQDSLTSAQRRAWRRTVARAVADRHDGVARRADLLAAGLTDNDIVTEVRREVWYRAGRHTICVEGRSPEGRARLWTALWESGPRAVLDGVSSLLAAGLEHWTEETIHVSVPANATIRSLPGVRHHVLRDVGPVISGGLPRTRPEVAVIRAAQWAASDRAAATLIAMAVQQGLVDPAALLARWSTIRRSPRRALVGAVIRDVCDGARSLNELDVAAACRARGLPEPSRQVVRPGKNGRYYLDLYWEEQRVHAEIQGAQHFRGLKGVDDAVRFNELAIGQREMITLQIPVLGWRLDPGTFLDQIERALEAGARRAA